MIVNEKFLVAVRCVGLVESVTVIPTVPELAPVGVPLITPLDALMLNPAGSPVADHVYGVVPPVAATVALYAAPALPPGNDAVVMVGGAMIVIARLAVAVRCVGLVESVTVTTAVLAPAVVGLPLMTPVEALMLRPAGRPVADQVYGVEPPLAATVALYAVPTTPPGSGEVVVIETVPAGRMASEKEAVAV